MITIDELVEQLEGQHEFEHGLIDPVDWERFTCWDLLQVIAGKVTIQDLIWHTPACEAVAETPEAQEKIERRKLVEWNTAIARPAPGR